MCSQLFFARKKRERALLHQFVRVSLSSFCGVVIRNRSDENMTNTIEPKRRRFFIFFLLFIFSCFDLIYCSVFLLSTLFVRLFSEGTERRERDECYSVLFFLFVSFYSLYDSNKRRVNFTLERTTCWSPLLNHLHSDH
jgi:hypothetical protein